MAPGSRPERVFIVFGVPVSLQAKSKSLAAWKLKVAESARNVLTEEDRLEFDDLRGTIVYFHVGECEPDIDNIVKPILDGAAGIAFGDDRQFAQVTVRRTQLDRGLELASPAPQLLLDAIERAVAEQSEFVYVVVSLEPVDHQLLP